jgi:hypothetical protein
MDQFRSGGRLVREIQASPLEFVGLIILGAIAISYFNIRVWLVVLIVLFVWFICAWNVDQEDYSDDTESVFDEDGGTFPEIRTANKRVRRESEAMSGYERDTHRARDS